MRTKEELNLTVFEKFIGHNIIINNDLLNETYCYENFQIDTDTYNCIVLIDGKRDMKTYILYNDIYGLVNKDDDLYSDVIYISATHSNYYIWCAEEKPIPIKCDKCGHIFEGDEQIWRIDQQGEYWSIHDGLWASKRLCDNCVTELIESD